MLQARRIPCASPRRRAPHSSHTRLVECRLQHTMRGSLHAGYPRVALRRMCKVCVRYACAVRATQRMPCTFCMPCTNAVHVAHAAQASEVALCPRPSQGEAEARRAHPTLTLTLTPCPDSGGALLLPSPWRPTLLSRAGVVGAAALSLALMGATTRTLNQCARHNVAWSCACARAWTCAWACA